MQKFQLAVRYLIRKTSLSSVVSAIFLSLGRRSKFEMSWPSMVTSALRKTGEDLSFKNCFERASWKITLSLFMRKNQSKADLLSDAKTKKIFVLRYEKWQLHRESSRFLNSVEIRAE